MGVENEINAISAFNYVVVEVDAELGKIIIFIEKWQKMLFNTSIKSNFYNKISAFLPSKQYSRQNSGNLS